MKRILKFGLPLLLLLGLVAWKMLTPKGPIDVASATTDIAINAPKLYSEFSDDETTANATYVGKVLEVSGELESLNEDDNGEYTLALNGKSDLGKVICSLAEVDRTLLSNLKIGKSVTVKGVCTGYLFDVVLDHSLILNL